MGGADPGRSHKGEEDCSHKTMRQKWSPKRRRPTPRDPSSSTPHKVKPLNEDISLHMKGEKNNTAKPTSPLVAT
jgi:hypothetical protein